MLGQIMLGIEGLVLSQTERDILQHPHVGGVILFSRNFQDIEQLSQLVSSIKQLVPNMTITVDQEGGTVQRFKQGFTKLPSLQSIGNLYDSDADAAIALAEHSAWVMASEMRAIGVDMSLAPVVDINYDVNSLLIPRSFHRDQRIVTTLALAYMKGMARAGMGATAKHFPGHGYVSIDTHLGIAHDNRSFNEIWQQDIQPFAKLIQENVNAIMVAHVIYPQVDAAPAGFSHKWITEILRHKLQFKGIIMSDDLGMAAAEAAGDVVQRVLKTIDAGADLAIVGNDQQGAIKALDALEQRAVRMSNE